jgi:hypothetical protein
VSFFFQLSTISVVDVHAGTAIVVAATPKALRTSSQPGLTRAVSTRLKLSVDPLVYAYDSPGVMVPFIGKGDRGAERGLKLALIGPCMRPSITRLMAC